MSSCITHIPKVFLLLRLMHDVTIRKCSAQYIEICIHDTNLNLKVAHNTVLTSSKLTVCAKHVHGPQLSIGLTGLQCFDTIGCAAGKASGLQKSECWVAGMVWGEV